MSRPARYCGRDFPDEELERIRALIAQREPRLHRSALSRAVCEALDWRKPDGGLKQMSARVALLGMQRDGLLTLPPPLRAPSRPRPVAPSPRTAPPDRAALPQSLARARPLRLSPLRPRDPRSRLWNEFVERHHYLGYKPLPGGPAALLRPCRRRPPAGPARLRRRCLENRPPRPLRRLGPRHARAQPAPRRQSRSLSHPAVDPPAFARLAPARLRRTPAPPRLAAALRPPPPSCWRPSAKPPASTAPATALPTGSRSARPRVAASSTRATSTPSPSRTSSSSPSVPTGGKSSIASSPVPHHGPLERLPSYN